jgi:hypothetical protein
MMLKRFVYSSDCYDCERQVSCRAPRSSPYAWRTRAHFIAGVPPFGQQWAAAHRRFGSEGALALSEPHISCTDRTFFPVALLVVPALLVATRYPLEGPALSEFAACLFLFQMANASILPLIGEILPHYIGGILRSHLSARHRARS